MNKEYFIVELEEGVWLANTVGDPGRTTAKIYAKEFKVLKSARSALTRARKYKKFKNARVIGTKVVETVYNNNVARVISETDTIKGIKVFEFEYNGAKIKKDKK